MLRPVPLAVVVVAHVDFAKRVDLLDYFVRRLYRDPDAPFSPTPAVPVVGGSIAADGKLVCPLATTPERTAVLVLLDDHAITDAQFLSALDSLVASATPDGLRVFIVPLAANATRIASAAAQTNFLRCDLTLPNGTGRRIASGLAHELCRWLQGRQRAGLAKAPGASEEPITIFLSHAKADGTGIAQEFQSHLQQQTRLNSFFDARDIAPGFPFDEEIVDRIGLSILLVIRTDAYGSREWCQREVLVAKRVGVPVVLVDALETTERRSFPYLGNVPTMRYAAGRADRQERVVDLLLDETLRSLHFRQRVERLLVDAPRKPVIFASPPELVRFALSRAEERRSGAKKSRARYVVYPDPPVSAPEAEVLAHDAEAIRAESLTQFVANRGKRLAGELVAISVSDASDPTQLNLSPLHQRDVVVEFARHLFAVAARIGYGGDFRRAGFAELLVQVARAHMHFGTAQRPQVVSYVPAALTVQERALYADVVKFETMDPLSAPDPSSARNRALELRVMRRRVASDAMALVAVGGRSDSFAGWRPGLAEEIATVVTSGRPVFLVGGFGGEAAAYARAAFLGGPVPLVTPRPALGAEPTDSRALPEPAEVVRTLSKRARNGLSKAQNARLAETVDTDELVELVLTGLAACAKGRKR